jgi:hypothetical protein
LNITTCTRAVLSSIYSKTGGRGQLSAVKTSVSPLPPLSVRILLLLPPSPFVLVGCYHNCRVARSPTFELLDFIIIVVVVVLMSIGSSVLCVPVSRLMNTTGDRTSYSLERNESGNLYANSPESIRRNLVGYLEALRSVLQVVHRVHCLLLAKTQ